MPLDRATRLELDSAHPRAHGRAGAKVGSKTTLPATPTGTAPQARSARETVECDRADCLCFTVFHRNPYHDSVWVYTRHMTIMT